VFVFEGETPRQVANAALDPSDANAAKRREMAPYLERFMAWFDERLVLEKLFQRLCEERPRDMERYVAHVRAAAGEAAEGDFRHWLWDQETWRFDVPRALVFFASLGLVRADKLPKMLPPKAVPPLLEPNPGGEPAEATQVVPPATEPAAAVPKVTSAAEPAAPPTAAPAAAEQEPAASSKKNLGAPDPAEPAGPAALDPAPEPALELVAAEPAVVGPAGTDAAPAGAEAGLVGQAAPAQPTPCAEAAVASGQATSTVEPTLRVEPVLPVVAPTPEAAQEAAPPAPLAAPTNSPRPGAGHLSSWEAAAAWADGPDGDVRAGVSVLRRVNGLAWRGGLYSGTVDGARLPHGRGALTYANGDEYRGGFVRGVRWGAKCAFLHSSDGSFFAGGFAEGRMHGPGAWVPGGGRAVHGEWVEGKVEGDAGLQAALRVHAMLRALEDSFATEDEDDEDNEDNENEQAGDQVPPTPVAPVAPTSEATSEAGVLFAVSSSPFGSYTAGPGDGVDAAAVARLTAMGFTKEQVTAALVASGGVEEAAVEALLA